MKHRLSLHTALVCLILLWSLLAGLYLARHDSMTTDEGIHVASAYLFFKRGEFRFDPEHPYLYKMLTALPLLPLHLNMPPNDQKLWQAGKPFFYDSWHESREWTDEWFYKSGNDAQLMVFLMRLPGVLCMVGLCLFVYLAAKKWFGPQTGLYALVFTAFNPTVLGHGHLANNDVAVTLVFFATVYAAWWYGEKQSWQRALLVGILCGAAQITKFSAVLLLPILALWMLYLWYVSPRPRPTARILGHTGLALLAVWAVIWLGYGWPFINLNFNRVLSGTNPVLQYYLDQHHLNLVSITHYVRYFLPVDFVKGFLMTIGGSVVGRPTYILNAGRSAGVWFYFPVVFAVKTQLVALLLLAYGIYLALYHRRISKDSRSAVIMISLASAVYAFFSIRSKLDLGIRHILPLLAYLSIALASVTVSLQKRFAPAPWLVGGILVAYILPVLVWLPSELSYTNLLVTPATNAYRVYDDSNIDWGQQAQEVAHALETRFAGQPAYLNFPWNPYAIAYFGASVEHFDPYNPPRRGVAVVTATQLAGSAYASFRDQKPLYHLSNHTFFYDLDPTHRQTD